VQSAGLLALAVMALSASAQADAPAPEPVLIRVLLLENRASVTVGDDRARSKGTVLDAKSAGISADRRPVGDLWRLRGRGVVRVDRLRVRGDLEVRHSAGGLQVINELGLEEYVAGTVGREVYPGWNLETLKAQAVVTRSYALNQRAKNRAKPYHLGSGTKSQVYGGVDAETPEVLAAVAATRGEYLAYQRQPILAVYHSASGGQTASAEEVWGQGLPYLVSVEVAGEEDSPDTYWRSSISRPKLGRALTTLGIQVGSPRDLRVTARSPSGRALHLRVRGEKGEHSLEARALRTALGESVIRSTLFEVRVTKDAFVFVGSGHGHGVGMSQWGAEAMANSGASYREILQAFYPGTSLIRGESR
jgi:stage II sporulation protein D